MKQTAELQKELQALAQTQVETADLIQQQEADLEKERSYSEQLRRKYKVCNQFIFSLYVIFYVLNAMVSLLRNCPNSRLKCA